MGLRIVWSTVRIYSPRSGEHPPCHHLYIHSYPHFALLPLLYHALLFLPFLIIIKLTPQKTLHPPILPHSSLFRLTTILPSSSYPRAQYPSEPVRFTEEPLILHWGEGMQMLRDAGHEVNAPKQTYFRDFHPCQNCLVFIRHSLNSTSAICAILILKTIALHLTVRRKEDNFFFFDFYKLYPPFLSRQCAKYLILFFFLNEISTLFSN